MVRQLSGMYFRTKKIKDSALVQLVESYRNAEGQPRQRVVVSLGDADLPEGEKHLIARCVESHLLGQEELLPVDLSEEAAAWVRRILQLAGRSKSAQAPFESSVDGVVVDRVESENVAQLGPQLVAMEAWKELGLGRLLEKSGLNASQIATAQLLVAGRLIEPSSEWALIDWAERTALPELLGIRITKSGKDRLYHAGDARFGLEEDGRRGHRREVPVVCAAERAPHRHREPEDGPRVASTAPGGRRLSGGSATAALRGLRGVSRRRGGAHHGGVSSTRPIPDAAA